MKVAIIRGPNLNKFEMQNYEPLVERYELTGFTTHHHNFEVGLIDFPVKKLRSIMDLPIPRLHRIVCKKLLGDSGIMFGLQRSIKGFDIVHAAEITSYYSYQAVKAKKIGYVDKVVLTIWENVPKIGLPSDSSDKLKKRIIEGVDHFLAISERTRLVLRLEGVPDSKISVITMGIDVCRFTPGSKDDYCLKKLGLTLEDIVVLTICNLNYLKGPHILIYAAKALLDENPHFKKNLKFVIVGKGKLLPTLQHMTKIMEMESNFKFIPGVSYKEIPNIYRCSDIFVLLSIPTPDTWQEQLGMVLLEAMASGKAIITTKSGSIPEVVGNAAVLIQPGDTLSTYNALNKLIKNINLRKELEQLARERALSLFDSKKVAERIDQLYQSL